MTRRGIEAGDEVAEVTSLPVGGGLLGQEGEGSLRGSEPRPAGVEPDPPSPPRKLLILGQSEPEEQGNRSRRSDHSPPASLAGADTSLVQCVPTPLLWDFIHGPPDIWLCLHQRQPPRSWSFCFLALTHLPMGPDLPVDESLSLCSGMWGNQRLWRTSEGPVSWALCPRVYRQPPCLE